MKLKYNVGDVVTINPNLKCGFSYRAGLASDMIRYAGETHTIRDICSGCYKLYGNEWYWSDDMLIGYDGFFVGNSVILPDGSEGVIAHKINDEQYIINGIVYSREDLRRIDGFDYTCPTFRRYCVGEYVKIDINIDNNAYGSLSVTENIRRCNNKIGQIVRVKNEVQDGGRYEIVVQGEHIICNSLMLSPAEMQEIKVDDKVYCGGVATVLSIEEDCYRILLDNGITTSVSKTSLERLDERNVTLKRDIFGIGNIHDKIDGFYSNVSGNLFVTSKLPYVHGVLLPGEYIKD